MEKLKDRNGLWVNTELFSPIVRDGIPDPDSRYYDSWWYEQRDIITGKEGYSVGGQRITGDQYFYLNFWKIRGVNRKTNRKGIISPRFLELDYQYFNIIERARNENKNVGLTKARQTGFSEKNACLIGKEFTFYPASQSVIVSGLDFYTQNTMNFVKRGLNNLAGTEFFKRKMPDRKEYMRAAFNRSIETESGTTVVVDGYMSEVYAITAKNNPQAVSSRSPSYILFEEAGVFPGVIETYKFVKPSMYSEGIKTGLAVFVGTGGEMDKGAAELEYIIFHPDEFDLLTFDLSEWEDDVDPGTVKMGWFCPKSLYKIIDQHGNPLIEESVKKIHEERDAITDEEKKYTAITQDPLTPSESFMIRSGGYFGKGIANKLNTMKSEIKKKKELQVATMGDLDFVYDELNGRKIITGVEFTPNKEGIFEIIERPYIMEGESTPPTELYAAGTDSYDKDEANTSSSKLSTEIFKTFLHNGITYNKFVAGLHYRPKINEGGAFTAYEASAKLCLYYNAKNLIEWSNIRIFDWYEKHNFNFLLSERPDLVVSTWIKNSMVNNRYGIDPNTKSDWLSLLADYLKNSWHTMRSLKQIEAFIRFKLEKNYNCDVPIASALAYLNAYEIIERRRRKNTEPKSSQTRSPMPRYKSVNGVIRKVMA